ncbi:MAG: hypothetical protein HYT70_01505 [Candidatus Aenigmarchaeota archaeon]|nr:hypothetical protein [Candidatus Aenigmarchaeota archaeon]
MKFEGKRNLRQFFASLAMYGNRKFFGIPPEEIAALSRAYGESGEEPLVEPDSVLGNGERRNQVREALQNGIVLDGLYTYQKRRLRIPGEYTLGDALDYARENWDRFHVRRHLTALGFLALVGGIAITSQMNSSAEYPVQPSGQQSPVIREKRQESNRPQYGEVIGILPSEIKVVPGFNLWGYCSEWQKGLDPVLNPVSNCVDYSVAANSGRYDALGRPLVADEGNMVRKEFADRVPAQIKVLPIGVQ